MALPGLKNRPYKATKGAKYMKKITLFLLIVTILSPVVIFAEPKWVRFAVLEGNGTTIKKLAPVYFDVDSVEIRNLDGAQVVTVKIKCLEFATAQGYPPKNPYVIRTHRSYSRKPVDIASAEYVMLRYPTMSYAAPRYPNVTQSPLQAMLRGPVSFQDIPVGSILEKLYNDLLEQGYVTPNTQVAKGRK